MQENIDISIIVPVWRGASQFLPKLFETIPKSTSIEIIVVDNSAKPLKREEIASSRDIIFLNSAPERHAGGSRNDGMAIAQGRWLLFADADDYFTPDAFDIFNSYLDSDADIIFTKPEGIYTDTKEHSNRGDQYIKLVHGYCIGETSEKELRFDFGPPWCKMIRRSLVVQNKLKFDEIRACNDIYFSLTCGYYAKKVEAVDKTTYVVTVNRGSLTQHRDYEVLEARLIGTIHYNKFMKDHGYGHHQKSLMLILFRSRNYGLGKFFRMIITILKEHQNPFIGWRRWIGSIIGIIKNGKKDDKYIVR